MQILLKHATLGNKHLREIENETLAKKINEERVFEAKIEDPLDEVVEIIDVPDIEHKKSMFPYDKPTVETTDEIQTNQKLIDDGFIDLQTKFDRVNDVATKQKKEKKIEDTIESVVDDANPFSTFDDFWWKDEMFSERDSVQTVDASKDILEEINEMSDNIIRNLRPVDTRTEAEKIEDQYIPIDNRTHQELEDDDYLSFESESEDIEIENIDTTSAWDDNKSTAAKPGQIFKLSTDYNKKIRAANKIKNKYLKKKIGQREKSNKISTEWLKTASYLDTKDQNKMNYIFIPPKKETSNNIPADAAYFIRTEIDSTDFKKENLATKSKKRKQLAPKHHTFRLKKKLTRCQKIAKQLK